MENANNINNTQEHPDDDNNDIEIVTTTTHHSSLVQTYLLRMISRIFIYTLIFSVSAYILEQNFNDKDTYETILTLDHHNYIWTFLKSSACNLSTDKQIESQIKVLSWMNGMRVPPLSFWSLIFQTVSSDRPEDFVYRLVWRRGDGYGDGYGDGDVYDQLISFDKFGQRNNGRVSNLSKLGLDLSDGIFVSAVNSNGNYREKETNDEEGG